MRPATPLDNEKQKEEKNITEGCANSRECRVSDDCLSYLVTIINMVNCLGV